MSQLDAKYSSPGRVEEAVSLADTTASLSTTSTISSSADSPHFSTQQRAPPAMQIPLAVESPYRKRTYRRSFHCQDSCEDEREEDEEDSIEGGESDKRRRNANTGSSPSLDEDRRAHHNELERRRRDHIKDHFVALKNSIPLLEGERSSRALILKRAVDYIGILQSQMREYKLQTEELRRQNDLLAAAAASAQVHSFTRPTMRQPTQPMCMQSPAGTNPPLGPTLSPKLIASLQSPGVKTTSTIHQYAPIANQTHPIATTNNGATQDEINGINQSLLSSFLLTNAAYFKNNTPPLPSPLTVSPTPTLAMNRTEHVGAGQPFYSLAPSVVTSPMTIHAQGMSTDGDISLHTSLLLNSLLLREKAVTTESAPLHGTNPSPELQLSTKSVIAVVSG